MQSCLILPGFKVIFIVLVNIKSQESNENSDVECLAKRETVLTFLANSPCVLSWAYKVFIETGPKSVIDMKTMSYSYKRKYAPVSVFKAIDDDFLMNFDRF